jgi:hypothetical protein
MRKSQRQRWSFDGDAGRERSQVPNIDFWMLDGALMGLTCLVKGQWIDRFNARFIILHTSDACISLQKDRERKSVKLSKAR